MPEVTQYYAKQINDVVAEVKKAVIGKDAIIIKTLLAPYPYYMRTAFEELMK